MAEALGVASSIAGLVSLADTVVRLGYKYIRDVKDAEKSVRSLVEEVNNLSGVLHSLNNVAQALEAQDTSVHSSSKIQHLYSCQITLEKITDQLEKAIPEVKSTSQKLKWPFKKTVISELLKEIQNHKSTMIIALNTQQMSTLIEILANQEQLKKAVADTNASMEAARVERRRLAADESLRRKLNLLGTIDVMKWQNSNIRLRQPGTGVWFTESKEFKDWASTDNSKLWVYGIPGAGKTILMASVIQEIEQHPDPSHGVAIFYCDYKDTQTHDSRTILGALARQLILQHEHAFTQLEAFCEKHNMTENTQGSATTDDFCEFIVELSRNFSTTSIVVDGLDEIAEDRAEVTRLLKSLNKPSGTIKTLLASRNEVDIRNVLEDYPCVSIAAKSGDLRLYVHSEIEKRTKLGKLRIRDHNLKDHIVKVLTEGADGMFRWVACQMDYLCECSTDRDRREALRKLPPDLPKSYERILDRVNRSSKENQALVRHTLLWVVYAEEPLTITQLLQALAVRPGDETFEKENMTTLDELLNWCSSLVRQKSQSDELELAHFTVKEYLLSLSEEYGPGLSQFGLSGDHAEIVKMCCDFLNLSEFDGLALPVTNFKQELKDFNTTWKEFEDNYSFMKYVLNSWIFHVHRSTWSEISDDVLLLFDETRSSYRLWTFGNYHYTMLSRCKYTQFLELGDLLSADHLNHVMGSLGPSAIHWAAMFALPDICGALIDRGADLNATSFIGSPLECAILRTNAIKDLGLAARSDLDGNANWRWDSRKKVMEQLIMAGADLDNIDVIQLLFQHSDTFAYCNDESDTDIFRLIFEKNPTFSFESLIKFLVYTLREREYSKFNYNNASLPVELLAWGARTNFAHFAPDTLPLFLAIIHDDLASFNYTPSSLEFFLDINFLGISRNDRMDTTPISQEHTEHWLTKLSASMLEFIRSSRVNSPNCLEKMILKVLAPERIPLYETAFDFIFRLWNNNIVLDFNWQNKVGNTILHQFLERVPFNHDWESAHTFILKAVSEYQANLTISNNLNITPIELLISRTVSYSGKLSSLIRIWRAGDISGACEKNPGLLERLLDAANSVDQVEYIFGRLAKDLDSHMQSLQDVLARYCTVDYMKELFSLRVEDGLQKYYISAPGEEGSDEKGSDDRASVVGEHKAYTTTDEEDNGNNGSSMAGLTRRGKYSITKDIHSSFLFVEEDQDNDLPTIESFNYAFSVANTEDVPTDKTLAESDGCLAVDEKTHSSLLSISGSHDSADFWELRLLLAHDPDLEIRNHQDLTPLAIAIRSKNLRAMYALLISGANIEARLSHRQTYLHLACCLGNKEAVRALLSAGADTSHKDYYGHTAADLAAIIGRFDIVDLFPEKSDHGSRPQSPCGEYSNDESPHEDLSDGEFLAPCVDNIVIESDTSDYGQILPLATFQDLVLRPKSSQSVSTIGE